MRDLPELTDEAVFWLTAIVLTICVIIVIAELTGLTDALINYLA